MADVKIDFEQIGAAVLTACPGLLLSWFPRGKVVGHEFEIGNLQGDAGKSLKINFRTGRWSDFATGEAVGDLISLYAAKHGLTAR